MRYEKIETANRLAAEFSRLCDVALSEMRERDWDYHIVGTKEFRDQMRDFAKTQNRDKQGRFVKGFKKC